MHLIDKITIKYFRSLHTVELKKCSSVNIISGRNDVGKSNVIKALNLFFNGQADWESEYDFYDNFSRKRLEEVRKESVKGKQFISVKIEFNRPENYKGSLPEKFTVERKWHRDNKTFVPSDNLSSLEKAGKLPSTLTTAQRSLGKLLNKIHFEYVPAIRDRAYVNDLLGRLQRSLLDVTINQNESLLATANTLAAHIEGQIVDLKNDFEQATSIQTSIEPPSSISSLFQSFLVSTETDDGNVPLKFRGDGLQSRYIASVLHYIAVNSNDFYIWGYEEPEIALEYSHCSRMATDFCEKYARHSQIFLTTHSPAFIALEGDKASCYRVSQENSETIVANTSISGDLAGKNKLKEELGILEIQKEVHELYSKELVKLNVLNQRIIELQSEVNELHRPLIVTEGKSDKTIFDVAVSKFPNSPDIVFRACDNAGDQGSTGGAGSLAKLIESIHPDDGRLVVAIFDNDEEGQREFERLSRNFRSSEVGDDVKRHMNGYAWAMLLPEPGFRDGYAEAKNLCIEYLFTDEVIGKRFSDGSRLELRTPPAIFQIGNQRQETPPELHEILENHLKRFLKVGDGKDKFSEEIVPSLDEREFLGFEEIFRIISGIIEYPSE